MSSAAGLQGATGRYSTTIYHWLITIEHEALVNLHGTVDGVDVDGALRLVNWRWAVISRGKSYVPAGFRFVPPGQGERAAKNARVSINNVDERITTVLESLRVRPSATVERVLAQDPNQVERAYRNFDVASAEWDAREASASLGRRSTGGPACIITQNPAEFPGSFK